MAFSPGRHALSGRGAGERGVLCGCRTLRGRRLQPPEHRRFGEEPTSEPVSGVKFSRRLAKFRWVCGSFRDRKNTVSRSNSPGLYVLASRPSPRDPALSRCYHGRFRGWAAERLVNLPSIKEPARPP